MDFSLPRLKGSLKPVLLGTGALLLFVWLAFFDSHSLLRRYTWQNELDQLRQENERLQQQIDELEHELATPLSDETVERIAREEYGMKRPDEVVYRVQPKK